MSCSARIPPTTSSRRQETRGCRRCDIPASRPLPSAQIPWCLASNAMSHLRHSDGTATRFPLDASSDPRSTPFLKAFRQEISLGGPAAGDAQGTGRTPRGLEAGSMQHGSHAEPRWMESEAGTGSFETSEPPAEWGAGSRLRRFPFCSPLGENSPISDCMAVARWAPRWPWDSTASSLPFDLFAQANPSGQPRLGIRSGLPPVASPQARTGWITWPWTSVSRRSAPL